MRILNSAVPAVTILLVTVLAALPWGIGPEHRFFLPHLSYLAIHYWTLRYPERVPEWAVFASGLTLDVMTSGPLGYWSLVFLIGYVIAVLQSPWAGGGKATRWGLVISALVMLGTIEWGLASLYYFEWADWRPYAMAAFGIGLAYPLIAFMLQLFNPAPDAGRTRGRGG